MIKLPLIWSDFVGICNHNRVDKYIFVSYFDNIWSPLTLNILRRKYCNAILRNFTQRNFEGGGFFSSASTFLKKIFIEICFHRKSEKEVFDTITLPIIEKNIRIKYIVLSYNVLWM